MSLNFNLVLFVLEREVIIYFRPSGTRTGSFGNFGSQNESFASRVEASPHFPNNGVDPAGTRIFPISNFWY